MELTLELPPSAENATVTVGIVTTPRGALWAIFVDGKALVHCVSKTEAEELIWAL